MLVFLVGIATVLLAFGKFDYLGWITRGHNVKPQLLPGRSSPGQNALVKCVVVALLFLTQTLAGGALGHFRADPGSFYGFQLERIFPSNLLRTWHLQLAIFWIATAYVAAALFLGRSLRKDEPRWLAAWTHVLFGAFAVVIFGSLLAEWARLAQLLGRWWFWFGNQGWEYLELGRVWQGLLVAGLFAWFAPLWSLVRPRALTDRSAQPIVRMFLLAALAIPMFYIPAMFFGAKTNFTVVDTLRFWIVHLWVEGFFEFFATTIVALTFYQLGLTRRNVALRVIYLDGILYFMGGVIGTGHHWYLLVCNGRRTQRAPARIRACGFQRLLIIGAGGTDPAAVRSTGTGSRPPPRRLLWRQLCVRMHLGERMVPADGLHAIAEHLDEKPRHRLGLGA